MRLQLRETARTDASITLAGRIEAGGRALRFTYPTRTGALLRIDGAAAGAFDLEHADCVVTPAAGPREIVLEVERRSLPISNLPAGDGWRWRLMLARAGQPVRTSIAYADAGAPPAPRVQDVAAFGHSHLDVAWLWRFADTRRKALRTFATALRQVDAGAFVFAQSQPQLYAWVEADDPALFARVRARIGAGWDASVAAMWVEPDLHAPSGESVLRQLAYGMRYACDVLGVDANVLWLPDTFGFPSTLPTLAVHAGVAAFATTKLEWNDTTRWPYPQFVWTGPDGSALPSAVFASYEGGVDAKRAGAARARHEPLVVGYGDGGGGATDRDIAAVPVARWTSVAAFFAGLDCAALPSYAGELYLETHRGTYTTHRDVKARSAALERALDAAEEACAWCVAVRAPASVMTPLLLDLRTAWTIVLRAQFHDVMAGTSIGPVYADVHADYDKADRIAERVRASALSVLPRAQLALEGAALAPERDGREYAFANAYVRARVRDDGTVVELGAIGGPNVATLANALIAYVDRPKQWDAWNLDRGYVQKRVRVKPRGARIEDDALVVNFTIGKRSTAALRIELRADEPFVRVELAVNWHEDHTILRVEHRLAVNARDVRYGQPHGSLVRTAYPHTPAERARFEVPAQRYALVDDGERGCAVLAPDTYGWSAAGLRGGGVRLGLSLLRSPRWPDPGADRGEHRIAWALAPTAGAAPSACEAAFRDYTAIPRVRLFTGEDAGVLVVATKAADDGDGVIVRVRECDGERRDVALRCGGRMRAAHCVDGVERTTAGEVRIDAESLRFTLEPFALRSFRVTF